VACWRAPSAGADARLDPALRRVLETRPDSVVGVLVRTTAPLTDEQRVRLERDGVAVATVVGTIFTARARARAAARLADLPFVVHVQLAATVPTSCPAGATGGAPQYPPSR
jgi:hypothetical protein